MNNAKDLQAYRFNGTVELPWAKVEDLELQQVKALAVYESGVLRLEELVRSRDADVWGRAAPAADRRSERIAAAEVKKSRLRLCVSIAASGAWIIPHSSSLPPSP